MADDLQFFLIFFLTTTATVTKLYYSGLMLSGHFACAFIYLQFFNHIFCVGLALSAIADLMSESAMVCNPFFARKFSLTLRCCVQTTSILSLNCYKLPEKIQHEIKAMVRREQPAILCLQVRNCACFLLTLFFNRKLQRSREGFSCLVTQSINH